MPFATQILQTENIETLLDIPIIINKIAATGIGLATCCGLELALLDAFGKEKNINILKTIGKPKRALHYSGVIPLMSNQKLEKMLPLLQSLSFKNLKLKVGRNIKESMEQIKLIRAAFPTDTAIRVDANCSWTLADARVQIPQFLQAGIHSFEQLFPKEAIINLQKVTQLFNKDANIMVDESVTSIDSAKHLIKHQICNHFNLKISKHGGIFNTLSIYNLAQKHGIKCQLGAHFGETSILTMAGLIVASQAPNLTAIEGAFGTRLLQKDICPSVSFDAQAKIDDWDTLTALSGWGLNISPKMALS